MNNKTSLWLSTKFSGVDLDAGSIIGIVVGALVLLLIVFILIFARATGRWCFAGEYLFSFLFFLFFNDLHDVYFLLFLFLRPNTARTPIPFGEFSCTFVTLIISRVIVQKAMHRLEEKLELITREHKSNLMLFFVSMDSSLETLFYR